VCWFFARGLVLPPLPIASWVVTSIAVLGLCAVVESRDARRLGTEG
jgi:hypothetical protein